MTEGTGTPTTGQPDTSAFEPSLPAGEPVAPPPVEPAPTDVPPGGYVAYRSDQERRRSVHRRANPWWRRGLRALIGLILLAALATGVYFGAVALRDYLERDRLPAPGAELPTLGWSTFLITSHAPGPELDGTLQVDLASGAYQFVGRPGGDQAGIQVVEPAGSTPAERSDNVDWHAVTTADPVVDAIHTALPYLRNVRGPDDVLENRLRRGFVDLTKQTKQGSGDAELTQYDMTLNTQAYSNEYPLQWQTYQGDVSPGLVEANSVPMTMVLDTEHVVVRLEVPQSNWAWERTDYGAGPFVPDIPEVTS